MQSTGERGSLEEPLISVKEAATLLKVSRVMVYRRYHEGVFTGRRIGRKIDLHRPLIDALHAEICAGRPLDVDEFAAAWKRDRSTGLKAVA